MTRTPPIRTLPLLTPAPRHFPVSATHTTGAA